MRFPSNLVPARGTEEGQQRSAYSERKHEVSVLLFIDLRVYAMGARSLALFTVGVFAHAGDDSSTGVPRGSNEVPPVGLSPPPSPSSRREASRSSSPAYRIMLLSSTSVVRSPTMRNFQWRSTGYLVLRALFAARIFALTLLLPQKPVVCLEQGTGGVSRASFTCSQNVHFQISGSFFHFVWYISM